MGFLSDGINRLKTMKYFGGGLGMTNRIIKIKLEC